MKIAEVWQSVDEGLIGLRITEKQNLKSNAPLGS